MKLEITYKVHFTIPNAQSTTLFKNPTRFGNWSQTMMQEMCVLSGCDYILSIKRIGLKKTHSLIHRYRSLPKAIEHLRKEGKYDIPDGYEDEEEKYHLQQKNQSPSK